MSKSLFFVIFALLCLTFLTEAVQKSYFQCKDSPEESSSITSLSITDCGVPPCPLKKGRTIIVEETFSVDRNVSKLKTRVYAEVYGVKLPFVGVDGQDACSQIYNMDDTKATCPLEAGSTYKYKNSFKIYMIYPNIKTTVTWKLVEELSEKKKDTITCFNVNAQIKL